MSIISDQVLNKIKKEKLAPKPKWQFQLRDGGKWLGFGLLISLAVAAVGLLMFFWSDGPWLHGGSFGFSLLFGRMPLILIFLVALGGLFALFDFKNIGRGYRYSLKVAGPILIISAIFAGWLLYYSGLSQGLDSAISKAPFYQDRQMYMMQIWQNSDKGLIAGEITDVIDSKNFYLRDLNGKQWKVDASDTLWRHNLTLEIGLEIKLIGAVGDNNFRADEIRPWLGAGGCGMMKNQGSCGMMK